MSKLPSGPFTRLYIISVAELAAESSKIETGDSKKCRSDFPESLSRLFIGYVQF